MNYFLAVVCLPAALLFAPHSAFAAPLTLKEAIVKVEHDTGGKVLQAETKRTGKQAIYRIKVLTRDGRVKVVEIPAE